VSARLYLALKKRAKQFGDWLLAVLVVALVQLMRLLPTNAAINASAWVARTIGPLLPAHRIGRKNLTLALPERG
jgi:KDO2-lipid IV(A) lauroyltransferase